VFVVSNQLARLRVIEQGLHGIVQVDPRTVIDRSTELARDPAALPKLVTHGEIALAPSDMVAIARRALPSST